MKRMVIIAAAVLTAGSLKAGELEAFRTGAAGFGINPAAEVPAAMEIAPGRAMEGEKVFLNPKIHVTPVTESWKDAMLVKFRKSVDVEAMQEVLGQAGLLSRAWIDNGDGLIARVDIADAEAPQKALLLAEYSAVEAVQVNKTVYRILSGVSKSAPGFAEGAAAQAPAFFKVTPQLFQYGQPVPGVFMYSNSVIFYADAVTAQYVVNRVTDRFEKNGRRVLSVSRENLNGYYFLSIYFAGEPVRLFRAAGDGYRTREEAGNRSVELQNAFSAAGYTVLEAEVKAFGSYLFQIVCAQF